MTTHISTKFAALTIALMINGVMIGCVAILFSGPHDAASQSSQTAVPAQVLI